MSQPIPTIAIVFKTVTLLLGAVVTYLAFKAYRRTRLEGLKFLSLGFGIVTLGALLAGVADQMLSVDAHLALTVESALTMVGFFVITYSLYATRRGSREG